MIILSRISLLLIALILEARISYADDYEDWPPGELKAAWYTVPIINLTEYKNRIKERHRQMDEHVKKLVADEPKRYAAIMAKRKADKANNGTKGTDAKPESNPQVETAKPASKVTAPVLNVAKTTQSVPTTQVSTTTGVPITPPKNRQVSTTTGVPITPPKNRQVSTTTGVPITPPNKSQVSTTTGVPITPPNKSQFSTTTGVPSTPLNKSQFSTTTGVPSTPPNKSQFSTTTGVPSTPPNKSQFSTTTGVPSTPPNKSQFSTTTGASSTKKTETESQGEHQGEQMIKLKGEKFGHN